MSPPPVIQRADSDVVFLAIRPPRHPAFGKAVDDAADFLLASHPAIFGGIARPIKTGSSDAYEHRTAEQQAELAVIRARDAIVRARTLLVNSARGIAKGFGVRLPKSITGTFGKRALDTLPEFLRTALAGLLDQIDALSKQIAGYDQQIGELAGRHPELARLESIPGVGRLTALTFVLTLGRAGRFTHSRDVAGFLGLRPKQRQSGARDPQLGISKSGDAYVRKLLVQCSHYILGHGGRDSALRQWGLAKSEGGKKATLRAIVAVARKLSVLLHRLWVSGEFYKPFPKMA